jgi:F-type H+-transporting ATPase subunit b
MLAIVMPLAQAADEESSNFLVSPDVGLMIWTLIAFLASLFILRKYAWPAITQALEKRQHMIEESIDTAERARAESAELLEEYRARLREARAQSEEIIARARKAGEVHERESVEEARAKREELLEQTRRDIEAETRRAIQEIRSEVANLTILATEKVTRKTLTDDDQKRLVEEALGELDFSSLGGEHRN